MAAAKMTASATSAAWVRSIWPGVQATQPRTATMMAQMPSNSSSTPAL